MESFLELFPVWGTLSEFLCFIVVFLPGYLFICWVLGGIFGNLTEWIRDSLYNLDFWIDKTLQKIYRWKTR